MMIVLFLVQLIVFFVSHCDGLESLAPVQEFTIMKPESDSGSDKITAEFMESVNTPDTLDTFLDFLKEAQSPISSVMELQSLLLAQKEEKVVLQNLIHQMKIDMQGVRSLVKLQAEEIRIHAEELSKVWRTLDEERETRRKLEDHVANTSNTSSIQDENLAGLESQVKSFQSEVSSRLTRCEKDANKNHIKTTKAVVHVLEMLTNVSSQQEKGLRKVRTLVKKTNKMTIISSSSPPATQIKMEQQQLQRISEGMQQLQDTSARLREKSNNDTKAIRKLMTPLLNIMHLMMNTTRQLAKKCNSMKMASKLPALSHQKGDSSSQQMKPILSKIEGLSMSLHKRNYSHHQRNMTRNALQRLLEKVAVVQQALERLKSQKTGLTRPSSTIVRKISEEIRDKEILPLRERMMSMQEIIEKNVIKKNTFHDMVTILSNISFKVDEMSGKIEEHLRFPQPTTPMLSQATSNADDGSKRQEMYSSLLGLHNKVDTITSKIRHCKGNKIPFDLPNNASDVFDRLAYLNDMFGQQADLIEDTRSLLINSSIMQISHDNDDLKQAVRIADNELKIIMLIDQVSSLEAKMDRSRLHEGSGHLVSELHQHHPIDNEISNEKLVQQTKAIVNNHDKGIEIMENIETLKQVLPTTSSTPSSSMDIFIF